MSWLRVLLLLASPCLVASIRAQQGDRAAEDRAVLPLGTPVPEARALSMDESIAALRLQAGFEAQLVASEPLVEEPVQAVFDAAGRMWVVEMRSYMRDVDGSDELRPDGRIRVLFDRDGDGRMDEAKTFLSGLVLPRSVLPLQGGALVIAPPQILWVEDRDGDLVADRSIPICDGLDSGLANPEHSGNGLLWSFDNRIHLADDARVLAWRRNESGIAFDVERTALAGQWGIAHDDRGRLYFNYNEDWLRCDLVPRRYAARKDPVRIGVGMNFKLAPDPRVFPAHPTPGVNRGGRDGMLRDGWLQRHTAVCAPLVYRGDALDGCDGDVFVCEPAGNLVRRFRLRDVDGEMQAINCYDGAEFLAAADERFRPVNLTQGPDGALYVVDMRRGVIQHKNFVTTFLRQQIQDRKLEQPIGKGRIWRIASEGSRARADAPLESASTLQLVAALTERDGVRRDLAQQLLVQRQDRTAIDGLRALVRQRQAPSSLHAIGALDGLAALSSDDLRIALHAEDAGLLAFALRYCAAPMSDGDRVLFAHAERMVESAPRCVRWQLALTLGDVAGKGRQRAEDLLADLAAVAGDDAMLIAQIASSARGRESDLLRRIFAKARIEAGKSVFTLSRQVAASQDAVAQQSLLDAVAAAMQPELQREALAGFCADIPADLEKARGRFVFAATPPALAAMQRTGRKEIVPLLQRILASIEIRAVAPAVASASDEDLTDAERARVVAGSRVYGAYCAACHQSDGQGLAGLAPPLAGSEWVAGDGEILIKIALHGLRGPLRAAGVAFEGEMTPQAHLSDSDLAAALSYVRRRFAPRAACIAPEDVARLRKQHEGRTAPWPAAELQPR